jgi:hypothetical protein
VANWPGMLLAIVFLGTAVTAEAQRRDEVIEPSAKDMARMQQLTPEGVAAIVTIRDDELETVATLDTSRAFSSRGRFTDRVRSDVFLRALVDKGSGKIIYQVYENVSYSGDWRNFSSVNIATSEGPLSVPLQNISSRVLTCAYGLCAREDHLAFVVPETVLRSIAATYRPGASLAWRFRFKAQNGVDWEDRIMPAEIAGLLIAVDRFRSGRPAQLERGAG